MRPKPLIALTIRYVVSILLIFFSAISNAQDSMPFDPAVFDTVAGDPLRARLYTLPNGLKVFLSVYKDEPRFQSMIGVKAGSKHDPAEHTGLAHYLEHMLFKGTDKYGTLDYNTEKPLIDTIFSLYDRYGSERDSLKRAMLYKQIDSVSGVAARYAIPNEFDKMTAGLGVSGVNAFTSNEQTVYINNVPSHQLEAFLDIEAERFRMPVMRLFHTELEAVYEEKNRSLDNDRSKVFEALYAGLFPNHPYGTQTTIGTIEHLKNPSLKAISNYFNTYYVPNNMVISLSGDFDPDQAIRLIHARFGGMKSSVIPAFKFTPEKLIKVPVVREVYGPDAESVVMGFRFRGASSEDADVLTMVDYILSNGQAGLLDLNLNKKQQVLGAGSTVRIMRDYSVHQLSARAREGQSLEQVRDLLLGQIMEIKLGNFPDWILPAIVNQIRLEEQKAYESNMSRATAMLDAEVLGIPYSSVVRRSERLSRINKQQIIDFVRTWYGENYVIVFKRNGVDQQVVKVVKPAITPVKLNNEVKSPFLQDVLARQGKSGNPVFLDFDKDIVKARLNRTIPVYMSPNRENDLFYLTFTIDSKGQLNPRWNIASQALGYCGTERYDLVRIQEEFYKLGCEFSSGTSEDSWSLSLSGLNENLPSALSLFESLLDGPILTQTSLDNLVSDLLKRRADAKLNKQEVLARLTAYARYGADNPYTSQLSEQELKSLSVKDMTSAIRNFKGMVHRIDYYGPADSTIVMNLLGKYHRTPRGLQEVPAGKGFVEVSTTDKQIFFVHYPMKQAEVNFLSKGLPWNPSLAPEVQLYNRYFGGGMSSPVFQTMRESKALAYAVNSRYSTPGNSNRSFYNTAYIGTQVDKIPEALSGMFALLKDMPVNQATFIQARDGALQAIRSERITRDEVLPTYHGMKRMGFMQDSRIAVFNYIEKASLEDVVSFQQKTLREAPFRLALIADRERIDKAAISQYGELKELELETVFGY
ncbi:MAG: insulinase family protein [Sphingobacteriales bacterium]|nr:insulinase family protein [Sphingobacteriales bacterium]